MSSAFFTTGDGDIVLRAGQEPNLTHDFRVHKFILSLASPVFKDMFAFPQPSDQNHNEQPDIPVVVVSDPPHVLDSILRLIYPGVEPPRIPDLSALVSLFSTADKYNITSIYPVLRQSLKTFFPGKSPGDPLMVYIIACRFGFLEEAKQAVRVSTLEAIVLRPIHEKELRHISSVDLYRVMWFIAERERLGREKIQEFTLRVMTPGWNYNACAAHWVDCQDFYKKLERRLQTVFKEYPCEHLGDLNGVLAELPDPPPGCKPELQDEDEPDCPLRLSYIRGHLNLLANGLKGISDKLLESAFEKKL